MKGTVLLLLIMAFVTPLGAAEKASQANLRQQYVYVLRVAPRLQDKAAWGESENQAVARHFTRLAKATEAGQVILAGRTTEALDTTFGLVIFESESEDEARRFMQSDPAVVAGVMSATLHPYAIALRRKY